MSFDGDTVENDPSFPDFVDALNDVDETDPATAQNQNSIDDNNGGRIKLNEDEVEQEGQNGGNGNPSGIIRGVE